VGLSNYPANFQIANERQTKLLSVVVEIEGVPDFFSLGAIYKKAKYGDAGLIYGLPGLIYGALIKIDNVRDYLTLDGSLTISQRLEPEQGRASISTFSLVFIDKDGYFTNLLSPGMVVDEILGGRLVKIWLGFQNVSFPDDYFVVFRGYITSATINGPRVTFSLSDANQKRRKQVFKESKTRLTSSIDASQTNIPVISTSDFYQRVLGPNGTYDTTVRLLAKIEDEWLAYQTISITEITAFTRPAAIPTGYIANVAATHAIDTEIGHAIEIGPINVIDFVLKIMLSGWAGPWITGEAITALGTTLITGNYSKDIILLKYSATEQYGLVTGDYITVTGSTGGNNGTYIVQGIDTDYPNVVYIDQDLAPEYPCTATISIRSQFDTFPVSAGLRLKPTEVDIQTHIDLRDSYINGPDYMMKFTIEEAQSGKEFIESQVYLPIGCYSLTRYGRLSIGYTRPPVLIDDKLIVLDKDTVVDPNGITFTRALNNRRFYNEIIYEYTYMNYAQLYQDVFRNLSNDSLNKFDEESSIRISSRGIRNEISGNAVATTVSNALLKRFQYIAPEIQIKTNFGTGVMIESGDVILLKDNGDLKIPNIATGERNLKEQLFEVIDRSIDIKTGTTSLKLLAGVFDSRFDRYGGISPSSKIISASTTSAILDGINESRKWSLHIGSPILIHNLDYSYSEETTLLGFSPSNTSEMIYDAVSVAPSAGYWIDIVDYPTSTDQDEDRLYKLLYAHISPSVNITGVVSDSRLTVSSGDIGKFWSTCIIIVHNSIWTNISQEVTVTSIVGNDILLSEDLSYSPSIGHVIEFIGFADQQGAYRIV